jgi:hypothetical protein
MHTPTNLGNARNDHETTADKPKITTIRRGVGRAFVRALQLLLFLRMFLLCSLSPTS